MIRSIVPSIILFLLPFAVYFLWLGRQRRAAGETEVKVSNKYLAWAAAVGLALGAGAFVIFTEFGGAAPDAVFVPPRFENGKMVPGHFVPRERVP